MNYEVVGIKINLRKTKKRELEMSSSRFFYLIPHTYLRVATAVLIRSQASTNCSSEAAVEIRIQLGAPKLEPATVATKEPSNNHIQKSSESLINVFPSDFPK